MGEGAKERELRRESVRRGGEGAWRGEGAWGGGALGEGERVGCAAACSRCGDSELLQLAP